MIPTPAGVVQRHLLFVVVVQAGCAVVLLFLFEHFDTAQCPTLSHSTCQGYLVGLASLTTHMPGNIIKAGPGPSSQRETTRLLDALSDLRFGGARTGPTIVPIGTHFQNMSSRCACSGLKGSHHTRRVAFPGEIALIEIFCLIAW